MSRFRSYPCRVIRKRWIRGQSQVPDKRRELTQLLDEIESEAYARGYSDAMAHKPLKRRGRPPTRAIALVRNAIVASDGIKGIEIFRQLEAQGTPVLERTVRTCLARLRESRAIVQRKRKWFAAGGSNGTAIHKNFGEALGPPPR